VPAEIAAHMVPGLIANAGERDRLALRWVLEIAAQDRFWIGQRFGHGGEESAAASRKATGKIPPRAISGTIECVALGPPAPFDGWLQSPPSI
jgi:hypothetical protein